MMYDNEELQNKVLAAALCGLPPGPFTFAALEKALCMAVPGSELRLALWRLQKAGRIAVMQKLSGELLYAVPFEKQPDLIHLLFGVPEPESDDEPTFVPNRCNEVKDIVMDMLALVHNISLQRPTLTKKGNVGKKTAEGWTGILSFGREAAEQLLKRKQAVSPYPASVSVVLDLCFRSGILISEEGEFAPHDERLAAWLRLNDGSKHQAVHRLWMQVFCPNDPLVRLLAFSLSALRTGRPLTWSDAERWWNKRVLPLLGTRSAISARSLAEELSVWGELGWVEPGKTKSGELAFRPQLAYKTRDEGSEAEESRICLQSDFEMMIPSGGAYRLHYLVSGFGDLVRNDRMRVYRITRETVQRAYSRGWTAERISALLLHYSVNGMPEPIADALGEWEKTHNRLRFEPVVAVRFFTAEAAEETASLPDLQSVLKAENRLNETTYIVEPVQKAQITEVFTRLGLAGMTDGRRKEERSFDERLRMLDGRIDESVRFEPVHGNGLFHSPFGTGAYKRVETGTNPAELYPGLERVPSVWLQECRPYHVSTLKTILERALEWRCYIQAVIRNERVIFAPARFADADCSTAVEGWFGETRFSMRLSEIRSIRLLLPGIHDDKKFISKTDGIRDMIVKV